MFPPIVDAVNGNTEIKDLFVFSWYDFPMYTEFHDSSVIMEHDTCEYMNRMLIRHGYSHTLDPYERPGNYTEADAEQNWIDIIHNFGN